MYILHIQGSRVVWLSCNKLSAGFLSLACVSAKRGGKGSIDCFVWLICSAHYISRHRQICVIANIAAPVVFVMPQSLRNESSCSLTHTRGWGGWKEVGGGGIDSVILCAGKCKCRHRHELQTLDTCLEEATQTTTNNFAQTVLPLVCLLRCLLSFQVCPVSYGVSMPDCCRAKPQQSYGVQWSRFVYETSPSCIDPISPVQSNDIARFGFFSEESACCLNYMFHMKADCVIHLMWECLGSPDPDKKQENKKISLTQHINALKSNKTSFPYLYLPLHFFSMLTQRRWFALFHVVWSWAW